MITIKVSITPHAGIEYPDPTWMKRSKAGIPFVNFAHLENTECRSAKLSIREN